MRGMELKNEMEEARNYIFYVSDYIDGRWTAGRQ